MEKTVDNISREISYSVTFKIRSLIIAALICMLSGGFLGFRCGVQHRAMERDGIAYGISGQELHVHSVVWKDYPAWREVTFTIDGSISFITGKNGCITLDGLTDPDALEEVRREHNVSTDGKDLVYFDDVTYVINEGAVSATIPKVYNQNVILVEIR